MKANELLEALAKKLDTDSKGELADVLGVTVQTLRNWENRDEDLSPLQVATALAKSRAAAIRSTQFDTIRPIVEFYKINACRSKRDAAWCVFDSGDDATQYVRGLRSALDTSHGIYIFYDSRGRALYVGKARKQSLWREMNNAFNRQRELQAIALVSHPQKNQEFKPGYEKLRQPRNVQLQLYGMASYFSAYQIDDGMIDDMEALMIRGFANDLLNDKMETFVHTRG